MSTAENTRAKAQERGAKRAAVRSDAESKHGYTGTILRGNLAAAGGKRGGEQKIKKPSVAAGLFNEKKYGFG